MKVLGIIPSYIKNLTQGRNMLHRAVKSIRKHEPTMPLVIIDDGSPADGVVNVYKDLDTKYEGLYFKYNYDNLGYSLTVNRGLQMAKDLKADWAVTINSDIIFTQPLLKRLAYIAEKIPFASVIGAKLLYPDGRIQHAGVEVFDDGSCHSNFKHISDINESGKFDTFYFCMAVTGALQFIKVSALSKTGLYSDKYKLAFEDVEFCLRAWANGAQVFYDGSMVAVHAESATRGKGFTATEKESLQQLITDVSELPMGQIRRAVSHCNDMLEAAKKS